MTRRSKIVLSFVFLAFFGLLVRIGLLSVDESVKSVGLSQGSRTVIVAKTRGTIYDRNRIPLVNANTAYYATILPDNRLLEYAAHAMEATEYTRAQSALADNTPIVLGLNSRLEAVDGLQQYTAPLRYGKRCLASHLLGYLNGAKTEGVSGIEKAYNDVLQSYSGYIATTYPVNGRGQYLSGDELRIENTVDRSDGGVLLSIDSTIQKCAEDALASVNKGAVVVMNMTGETLAIASQPNFHPDNVEDYLELDNAALMNRALSQYDCGSVFKIVTALAALENGVSTDQSYDCSGSIAVDGHLFHCHQRLGHQSLTMDEAFAQSCNVYFIRLAQQIGADKLLEMAELLGLAESMALANTIVAPASVLPTAEDLTSAAALANFSFGQGSLLVTPLHVARMTTVVANGGVLPMTTAVLGIVDEEGNLLNQDAEAGETVISARSVLRLRRMMEKVVFEGTGVRAQPNQVSAAGKTGTAETGQLNNLSAVTHSWFTGYYPADSPQYVITVLVEDWQTTEKSAAELFCEIINNLE